jgi:hypothetical protein
VLRAPGETKTTQKNILDWLQLDEGDPGFQLLTEEEIYCSDIFYLFSSALSILFKFPFICFLSVFCLLGLSFASLIWMTSPP